MNGILCINKDKGVTSRDVVNQLCGILHTKKIGHTGTLDPLATGVLVLGVNGGTKLIEIITSYDKEYEAVIKLGIETDTLDITGNVVKTTDCSNITVDMIDDALSHYNCSYDQEVPKYSAVKINGKKLYEYARNNEDIELPSREVTIYSLSRISDVSYEEEGIVFSIRCHVSKGTYIRSLIRDIGKYLGVCACMVELKRTKQGNISLDQCYSVADIEKGFYKFKSINECLDCFFRVTVENELYKKIINGALIENIYQYNNILFVDKEGNILAIYKIYEKDNSKMKPWKMFKTLA